MAADSIKSARRVLEIFELLRELRRPISLKEVCDRLGYAPSSGMGLLKTLVSLGYLEYDRRSRTYLPTMRIAVLADWIPSMVFGRNDIMPIMQRLHETTGLMTYLGTRSDLSAQYVHVIHPLDEATPQLTPGSLRPLDRCGFGRLYLSMLNDSELDLVIRRLNAERRRTSEAQIRAADLLSNLAEIRRVGYAFATDLYVVGRGAITMLLPQSPFNRPFVLGIGGETGQLVQDFDAYLAALRDAVEEVTSAAEHWPSQGPALYGFGVPLEKSLLLH